MERRCIRTVSFLFVVFLTIASLTISVTGTVRINDVIYGREKYIPLKRTKIDGRFGFLREADFEQFDKESTELHGDRVRRNVDDSAVRRSNITEEFELKGDNHSVAFLHWAGKNSSVSTEQNGVIDR